MHDSVRSAACRPIPNVSWRRTSRAVAGSVLMAANAGVVAICAYGAAVLLAGETRNDATRSLEI